MTNIAQSVIKGANFKIENTQTGKTIFEMKRKDRIDYGGIYYVFKIYDENFTDIDDKDIFLHQTFSYMKSIAGIENIALFDADEIHERMWVKLSDVEARGVDLDKEQVDIEIEVMNYANNDLVYLTISVTTVSVEGKSK